MSRKGKTLTRESVTEVYRRDWQKRLGKKVKKEEKKQAELDELITHVSYDDAQLGREK